MKLGPECTAQVKLLRRLGPAPLGSRLLNLHRSSRRCGSRRKRRRTTLLKLGHPLVHPARARHHHLPIEVSRLGRADAGATRMHLLESLGRSCLVLNQRADRALLHLSQGTLVRKVPLQKLLHLHVKSATRAHRPRWEPGSVCRRGTNLHGQDGVVRLGGAL